MSIWKPGRRLFTTAALLMLLTAFAHTAGNMSHQALTAEEAQVFSAMAALRLAMGSGMNPSLLDLYWDLIWTMSVTFAALGVINLVAAASADVPDRVLRRIAIVNFLWVGVFLVLGWNYKIPPPLISAAIIEVFVAASLLPSKARQ
jgi:hypothetical protein